VKLIRGLGDKWPEFGFRFEIFGLVDWGAGLECLNFSPCKLGAKVCEV